MQNFCKRCRISASYSCCMNGSEVSRKYDLQNFCIQHFKPLAKDAEFLHHTVVVWMVAKLEKYDLQNFCIQRFKPLAKDAEFLHHSCCINGSEVSRKYDLQNFCIQRFKPQAKDAEFLHHTVVVWMVAKLAENTICRISASNVISPKLKMQNFCIIQSLYEW